MASFHHQIKSGKKGTAAQHAAYIARLGKYAKRTDLVETGYGNMPPWASDEPLTFWRNADLYERKNGAVYREHEIALPVELTRQQQIELAQELVKEIVGESPYQFAIHCPDSSLGSVPNPHMHLMYSGRKPDGIARSPEQTFMRYNGKNPEQGGCKKEGGGKNKMELRDAVIETRRKSAELQNAALEKYGHDARVDHRTLKQQGLKHTPEAHLGAVKIKGMVDEDMISFIAKRRGKN